MRISRSEAELIVELAEVALDEGQARVETYDLLRRIQVETGARVPNHMWPWDATKAMQEYFTRNFIGVPHE